MNKIKITNWQSWVTYFDDLEHSLSLQKWLQKFRDIELIDGYYILSQFSNNWAIYKPYMSYLKDPQHLFIGIPDEIIARQFIELLRLESNLFKKEKQIQVIVAERDCGFDDQIQENRNWERQLQVMGYRLIEIPGAYSTYKLFKNNCGQYAVYCPFIQSLNSERLFIGMTMNTAKEFLYATIHKSEFFKFSTYTPIQGILDSLFCA
jgi:hypothetical protein